MRLPFALAMVAALALAIGCSSNKSTPASLTIKGYTPTRGVTLDELMDPGRTVACDGPSSTCCNPGTGCRPTFMGVTVYKMWLAAGTNCASPVVAADNGASPTEMDITTSPTLISGTPADGTYHCMILKVNDTFHFRVNALTVSTIGGACSSTSTTYTFDIFRTGESWFNLETGAAMAGAGDKGAPSTQQVYVYASTDPTALPGTINSGQKITLGAPLVVAAASPTTMKLVVDPSDKINDDGGSPTSHCWMAPAALTFQ